MKSSEIYPKDGWSPEQVHFAVLAIEASAKKMGISPREMQQRLNEQDLIESFIVKYYDVFHTMSLEHIAEDTIEALLRREKHHKIAEK